MEEIKNHPLYKKHNIDSAMNSLWEFYKSRFVMLFIISFLMSLVIQYASTMVNFKELQTMTDPLLMFEAMKGMIGPIILISLINLLFSTVLQYYIIYNPLNPENNIVVAAIRSMKYFIPYLIILVLFSFAGAIVILLGLIALIIGVFFSILYLTTLYLFILPILMVEGNNIGNAISRMFSLVHRNFWSNIGWVAVFLIILIVISVILSAVILIPFSGSFLKTIVNPEAATELLNFSTNPVFIILSALAGALTMPLMPIFACILYFNGKAGEEEAQTVSTPDPVNDKVRVEDLYAKPYSDDHEEADTNELK